MSQVNKAMLGAIKFKLISRLDIVQAEVNEASQSFHDSDQI